MKKLHFRLTCVARKRRWWNSLLSKSPLSQRLLGLLPGIGKKWPIADRRVPNKDPRNNSGTHFASISLLDSQKGGVLYQHLVSSVNSKCPIAFRRVLLLCAITTPEDETIPNGFPQLKLELGFRNRNNPPNEAYGGTPLLDKFFIWWILSEVARAADERRRECARWDYRLLSSYRADRLTHPPSWRACSQASIWLQSLTSFLFVTVLSI